jgi:hypothetical protein
MSRNARNVFEQRLLSDGWTREAVTDLYSENGLGWNFRSPSGALFKDLDAVIEALGVEADEEQAA